MQWHWLEHEHGQQCLQMGPDAQELPQSGWSSLDETDTIGAHRNTPADTGLLGAEVPSAPLRIGHLNTEVQLLQWHYSSTKTSHAQLIVVLRKLAR